MIIKRKILKSIYGEDILPLELKLVPKPQFEKSNGNGSSHPTEQNKSIDALAEDLVQARVEELYALKEAEVAEIEKQAHADIQKALDDSKLLAQKILDDAQNQANDFKAKTLVELEKQKQEIDRLIKTETERGFKEGMAKAETYIHELMKMLSSFNTTKQNIFLEAKEQIASLAIHVARQILKREVQINPDLLEEQILQAINLVSSGKGIIQVYLNPIDQAKAVYLEKNLSKLIDESVKLIFLKDETVDEGSCIINTKGGSLDLSFSSQIDLIKVAFEMYLGHKIEEISEPIRFSEFDQAETESMPRDQDKIIKTKFGPIPEPSDEDLELIESEIDEFDDLIEDDDLDALLKEVLMDGADVKDDASVKIDDDIALSEIEDENYNNKEEEITLSYDDDDSLDLDEDKDDLADDDLDLDMDEFDELADDPEAGNDDLDDSGMDDRFPEY